MTGPLLLPADPVSAAQAADKHYVDASVAAISGGMGQAEQLRRRRSTWRSSLPAVASSTGLASPGPTHLWVDPTGYNLNGYGAGFTSLGVTPGNQGDCTQVGGLFGGHSCLGLSSTYNGYAYGDQIHWGTVNSFFTALGAGSYLGNDGVGRQDTTATILSNTLVRGTHVSDERAPCPDRPSATGTRFTSTTSTPADWPRPATRASPLPGPTKAARAMAMRTSSLPPAAPDKPRPPLPRRRRLRELQSQQSD